ncbi:probable serine/threonine-protein kinase DDB_G0268078 [Pseudochaenichthys georgianus]|uniref:probable serine/threonine-protein kinase DDB_G0268078 n=1 Tax=Pseudochaenichthys georgianus TaxID=52239 RepID=UPI00146A5C41|nr:probable serine/threonine-protein kinase DDB_G0268078 [Pseudochaenichthys georgianus]
MAYSTGTIAKGCFGKVYKQKYNDTWAAIKKVPQHLIRQHDLERESEVYKKANHPNIVKLLGKINLKDGKWIIPLEFIFGEDLETTIFKASQSKIQLTPSIKGTIITGMCEGLYHLHSKDIVHQDLKPENIMVEHDTNRAVIIDLGLAKFFRYGQNSAIDMGNEAYSAPEVLQRGSQRDQRSDVWAMGKIIAELCARVRLYTPSVCPAKINDILKDQPYCHVVCRMVNPDPTLRASMGGVMSEIKRVGGPGINPVQKDYLKPATPHISVEKMSPAPGHRGASPMNRDPSPVNRDLSPMNRDPTPMNRHQQPMNRGLSPMDRDRTPMNRNPLPMNRDLSPMKRDPNPMNRHQQPMNRGLSPMNRDPTPMNRNPLPINRDQSPMNRDPNPMNRHQQPMNRDLSPRNIHQQPMNRDLSPRNIHQQPMNRDLSPMNKAQTQFNRDPHNREKSPMIWERSPKPELKAPPPRAAMPLPPSPYRTEDKNKNQGLVRTGRTERTEDLMKGKFFQGAADNLPSNLPTTGRVVIQRFEMKNGEVETWEQKEVVTEGGKIVKFGDLKFDSK